MLIVFLLIAYAAITAFAIVDALIWQSEEAYEVHIGYGDKEYREKARRFFA